MIVEVNVKNEKVAAVTLNNCLAIQDVSLYRDALKEMFDNCLSCTETKDSTSAGSFFFVNKLIDSFDEKGGHDADS